jgi:prevent-host-death family protein
MWTVLDAKAHLSEILRRARAGEPQIIGSQAPCIVISAEEFQRLKPAKHLGQYLVDSAPRGEEIILPKRSTKRTDPFSVSDN